MNLQNLIGKQYSCSLKLFFGIILHSLSADSKYMYIMATDSIWKMFCFCDGKMRSKKL